MGDAAGGTSDPEALFRAIAALERLAAVFDRRRQQLAREAGLSDLQWRVLEEVGRESFMPSLFARSREAHPAAVSRVLRQLQERGWIRPVVGRGDGRRRRYALCAEGRRVLRRLGGARARAVDAVWADLPAGELLRFARFSERLAERLERYALEEEGSGPDRRPGAGDA